MIGDFYMVLAHEGTDGSFDNQGNALPA